MEAPDYNEIDDQVGFIGDIFALHMQSLHNGKTDPECPFCKAFLIRDPIREYPLESYKFIILDLSSNEKINTSELTNNNGDANTSAK